MIFLFIFSFILASQASAQEFRGSSPEKGKMIRERIKKEMNSIMDEIGITPEQKEQLQEQRKKHMGEFKEIWQQLKSKQAELRKLLKEKKVNMDAVEKVKKELLDLRAKDIDQKIQGTLEMKKILTEEQLNQLTEKIEAHRQKFKGRRDRFRKGGVNWDSRPEMPSKE